MRDPQISVYIMWFVFLCQVIFVQSLLVYSILKIMVQLLWLYSDLVDQQVAAYIDRAG